MIMINVRMYARLLHMYSVPHRWKSLSNYREMEGSSEGAPVPG